MSSKIECFVFDMAGTTIRDGKGFVGMKLAEAIGGYDFDILPEEIDSVMGLEKHEAIRKLLNIHVDEIYKTFEHRMVQWYKQNAAPIDGVHQALVYMRKKGLKVALNTGFPSKIADTIIDKIGWIDLVNILVTPDMVECGRPYPDMIRRISKSLQVDVGKIIKVGDTSSDIEEGHNANCLMSVGVTTGTCSENELVCAGADMVVDSIWELVARTQDRWGGNGS